MSAVSKSYTCDECGRKYASEGSFRYHKKAWDCRGLPMMLTTFVCPVCGTGLKNRNSFTTHLNVSLCSDCKLIDLLIWLIEDSRD